MPIRYVTGDATKPDGAGPKVIVHCCNDAGKWGRGFVLALSKMWPRAEAAYRAWHKRDVTWHFREPGNYTDNDGNVLPPDIIADSGKFGLGEVQFVLVAPSLWVANLIGQHGIGLDEHRRAPIRYDAIKDGLKKVCKFAQAKQAGVHMPRMGAGLAGGNWNAVAQQVEVELMARGVSVTVYDLP